MTTNTKLNGIDAGTYEVLEAATDQFDMLRWEYLPGDEDAQAATYWDASDNDLIDEHGVLEPRFQCDGCSRYFFPADLSVADGSGEYCWDDYTGNGCRNAHLPEDER